jgi:hypothetical protein
MDDFKLYHIRQNTTVSKFPGLIYLLLNLGICFLAIIDAKIPSLSDARCPEIDPYKESMPKKLHYLIIRWISFIMLLVFGLVLLIKLTSLLTFALCPVFKYRVTKKMVASPILAPDAERDSQKTLSFRIAVQRRK